MLRLTSKLTKLPLTLQHKSFALYRPINNQYLKTVQTAPDNVQEPMGSYVYIPRHHNKDYITESEIEAEAKAIF